MKFLTTDIENKVFWKQSLLQILILLFVLTLTIYFRYNGSIDYIIWSLAIYSPIVIIAGILNLLICVLSWSLLKKSKVEILSIISSSIPLIIWKILSEEMQILDWEISTIELTVFCIVLISLNFVFINIMKRKTNEKIIKD